jgi:hypothetical protein
MNRLCAALMELWRAGGIIPSVIDEMTTKSTANFSNKQRRLGAH